MTRGNHDDNGYHNDPWIGAYDNQKVPYKYVVWDSEWNRFLLNPLAKGHAVHDPLNPESTYYYVDDPAKKIRVVFLDAYACPALPNGEYALWVSESWNRFSDRQLKWFAEIALNPDLEDWTYILSSHSALIDGFVTGPCTNAARALEIITAFNQKLHYVNTALGIAADYTGARASMPIHIFGHTHRDAYHCDSESGLLMINTGNCKVGEYDCSTAAVQYCATPKRERGTITEALFDVIVLTNSGKVHRIRFGAGEDQEWEMQ